MSTVRPWGAVIGAVTGAVLIVGCGSGGGQPAAHDSPAPSISSPTTTSTAPSLSAEQLAVVRAYDSFWKTLSSASRAKNATQQLALLNPMTTDPELSQLMAGFARLHKQGRVLYGTNVPRPTDVSLTDSRAVVRDCQDSHSAGVERVATGAHLTVGVSRHLVTATLLLHGKLWKVSRVDYASAGTSC
jgi:hypothetical protein